MRTLVVSMILAVWDFPATGQSLLNLAYEGPAGITDWLGTLEIRCEACHSPWVGSRRANPSDPGEPGFLFARKDQNGNLAALGIARFTENGSSPQVFIVDNVLAKLGLSESATFRGAANLDGSPERAFIFEDEGDIIVYGITIGVGDVAVKWRLSDMLTDPGELIAVADFTNDGVDDLLVGVIDTETGEVVDAVQVWSHMQP